MKITRRALLCGIFSIFITFAGSAESTPSISEIWKLVQAQQEEITRLKQALANTLQSAQAQKQKAQLTEERLDETTEFVENLAKNDSPSKSSAFANTSIGGYGELHYNNVNTEGSRKNTKQADFHRYVLFFEHEFSDKWQFYSEFELEHALSKDTSDGSNSGEVELEQAYLQTSLNDEHYLRSGVFLVPIGILNETHEPATFYGVERNDVENIIIPGTWWEAGAAVGGHYNSGLSWDFAVHTGLQTPTSGGSAFRIRSGRQKVSKANADNLAYTFRTSYSGIPGLSLSATLHHQTDMSQFSGDGLGSANLISLQGIYSWEALSIKTLWSRWDMNGNAVELAGADKQTGWYIEPAWTFKIKEHKTGIYARYEDLNAARGQDQFDQWEIGMNYWPTESVVFKIDYRDRDHDLAVESGRDFKAFDLGLGYHF
ncbi:MAG: OprO/OprP family phosphate-selective porin [Pseudomonadales bacterium]|nr:OprO/OprP family phosphate-selective porin [Pseudomonadales bacterium]